MILQTSGILIFEPENVTNKHFKQSEWKRMAIIQTNDDLAEYYAWFLKKRFSLKLNPPLRGSHVTIISDRIIDADAEKFKLSSEKYNNTLVNFEYDTDTRSNGEHWWLRVTCEEAYKIRFECGLPEKPYFNLHLTLGHASEKNLWFSQYILETILRFNL